MPFDVKYLATKMIGVNLISVLKTLMFKHRKHIFMYRQMCDGHRLFSYISWQIVI